jgi:uncharacterized repeat protein (TIGR02543 family)
MKHTLLKKFTAAVLAVSIIMSTSIPLYAEAGGVLPEQGQEQTEQGGDTTDQTDDTTDQTDDTTNQTDDTTNQTNDTTDQTGDTTDQTGDTTNQTNDTTNQTDDTTDQTGDTTNQTDDTTNQTDDTTNQTGDTTNQTGDTTDQTGDQGGETPSPFGIGVYSQGLNTDITASPVTIKTPVGGQIMSDPTTGTTESLQFTVASVEWDKDVTRRISYETTYTATVTLTALTGFVFDNSGGTTSNLTTYNANATFLSNNGTTLVYTVATTTGEEPDATYANYAPQTYPFVTFETFGDDEVRARDYADGVQDEITILNSSNTSSIYGTNLISGDGTYTLNFDARRVFGNDMTGLKNLSVNVRGMYDGLDIDIVSVKLMGAQGSTDLTWSTESEDATMPVEAATATMTPLESNDTVNGDGWRYTAITGDLEDDFAWGGMQVVFEVDGWHEDSLGYATGYGNDTTTRGGSAAFNINPQSNEVTYFKTLTAGELDSVRKIKVYGNVVKPNASGDIVMSVDGGNTQTWETNKNLDTGGLIASYNYAVTPVGGAFTKEIEIYGGNSLSDALGGTHVAVWVQAYDGTRFDVTKIELIDAYGVPVASTAAENFVPLDDVPALGKYAPGRAPYSIVLFNEVTVENGGWNPSVFGVTNMNGPTFSSNYVAGVTADDVYTIEMGIVGKDASLDDITATLIFDDAESGTDLETDLSDGKLTITVNGLATTASKKKVHIALTAEYAFDVTSVKFFDNSTSPKSLKGINDTTFGDSGSETDEALAIVVGSDNDQDRVTYRINVLSMFGSSNIDIKDIYGYELDIRPIIANSGGSIDVNVGYDNGTPEGQFEQMWISTDSYTFSQYFKKHSGTTPLFPHAFIDSQIANNQNWLNFSVDSSPGSKFVLAGIRFLDIDSNPLWGEGTLSNGVTLSVNITGRMNTDLTKSGEYYFDVDEAVTTAGIDLDDVYGFRFGGSPQVGGRPSATGFNSDETLIKYGIKTVKDSELVKQYYIGGASGEQLKNLLGNADNYYRVKDNSDWRQPGQPLEYYVGGDFVYLESSPLFSAGGLDHRLVFEMLCDTGTSIDGVSLLDKFGNEIYNPYWDYHNIAVTFDAGDGYSDPTGITVNNHGKIKNLPTLVNTTNPELALVWYFNRDNGNGGTYEEKVYNGYRIDFEGSALTLFAKWENPNMTGEGAPREFTPNYTPYLDLDSIFAGTPYKPTDIYGIEFEVNPWYGFQNVSELQDNQPVIYYSVTNGTSEIVAFGGSDVSLKELINGGKLTLRENEENNNYDTFGTFNSYGTDKKQFFSTDAEGQRIYFELKGETQSNIDHIKLFDINGDVIYDINQPYNFITVTFDYTGVGLDPVTLDLPTSKVVNGNGSFGELPRGEGLNSEDPEAVIEWYVILDPNQPWERWSAYSDENINKNQDFTLQSMWNDRQIKLSDEWNTRYNNTVRSDFNLYLDVDELLSGSVYSPTDVYGIEFEVEPFVGYDTAQIRDGQDWNPEIYYSVSVGSSEKYKVGGEDVYLKSLLGNGDNKFRLVKFSGNQQFTPSGYFRFHSNETALFTAQGSKRLVLEQLGDLGANFYNVKLLDENGDEIEYWQQYVPPAYDTSDVSAINTFITNNTGATYIDGWITGNPSTWTGEGNIELTWEAIYPEDGDPKQILTGFKYDLPEKTTVGSLPPTLDLTGLNNLTLFSIDNNESVSSVTLTTSSLYNLSIGGTSITDLTPFAEQTHLYNVYANDLGSAPEYATGLTGYGALLAVVQKNGGEFICEKMTYAYYDYARQSYPFLTFASADREDKIEATDYKDSPVGIRPNYYLDESKPDIRGNGEYYVIFDAEGEFGEPLVGFGELKLQVRGLYSGLTLTPTAISIMDSEGNEIEVIENFPGATTAVETVIAAEDLNGAQWIYVDLSSFVEDFDTLVWSSVSVDFTVSGWHTGAIGFANGNGVDMPERGGSAAFGINDNYNPSYFPRLTRAELNSVTGFRVTGKSVINPAEGGTKIRVDYQDLNNWTFYTNAQDPDNDDTYPLTIAGDGTFTYVYEGETPLFDNLTNVNMYFQAFDYARFDVTQVELLNAGGGTVAATSQANYNSFNAEAYDDEPALGKYGAGRSPYDIVLYDNGLLDNDDWNPSVFGYTKLNGESPELFGTEYVPGIDADDVYKIEMQIVGKNPLLSDIDATLFYDYDVTGTELETDLTDGKLTITRTGGVALTAITGKNQAFISLTAEYSFDVTSIKFFGEDNESIKGINDSTFGDSGSFDDDALAIVVASENEEERTEYSLNVLGLFGGTNIDATDIYGYEIDVRPITANPDSHNIDLYVGYEYSGQEWRGDNMWIPGENYSVSQYFRKHHSEIPLFDTGYITEKISNDENWLNFTVQSWSGSFALAGIRFLKKDGTTLWGTGSLAGGESLSVDLSSATDVEFNNEYTDYYFDVDTAIAKYGNFRLNDVYGFTFGNSPIIEEASGTNPTDYENSTAFVHYGLRVVEDGETLHTYYVGGENGAAFNTLLGNGNNSYRIDNNENNTNEQFVRYWVNGDFTYLEEQPLFGAYGDDHRIVFELLGDTTGANIGDVRLLDINGNEIYSSRWEEITINFNVGDGNTAPGSVKRFIPSRITNLPTAVNTENPNLAPRWYFIVQDGENTYNRYLDDDNWIEDIAGNSLTLYAEWFDPKLHNQTDTPGDTWTNLSPYYAYYLDVDEVLASSPYTAKDVYTVKFNLNPYNDYDTDSVEDDDFNVNFDVDFVNGATKNTLNIGNGAKISTLLDNVFTLEFDENDDVWRVHGSFEYENADPTSPIFSTAAEAHRIEFRQIGDHGANLGDVQLLDENGDVIYDTNRTYEYITITFNYGDTGVTGLPASKQVNKFGNLGKLPFASDGENVLVWERWVVDYDEHGEVTGGHYEWVNETNGTDSDTGYELTAKWHNPQFDMEGGENVLWDYNPYIDVDEALATSSYDADDIYGIEFEISPWRGFGGDEITDGQLPEWAEDEYFRYDIKVKTDGGDLTYYDAFNADDKNFGQLADAGVLWLEENNRGDYDTVGNYKAYNNTSPVKMFPTAGENYRIEFENACGYGAHIYNVRFLDISGNEIDLYSEEIVKAAAGRTGDFTVKSGRTKFLNVDTALAGSGYSIDDVYGYHFGMSTATGSGSYTVVAKSGDTVDDTQTISDFSDDEGIKYISDTKLFSTSSGAHTLVFTPVSDSPDAFVWSLELLGENGEMLFNVRSDGDGYNNPEAALIPYFPVIEYTYGDNVTETGLHRMNNDGQWAIKDCILQNDWKYVTENRSGNNNNYWTNVDLRQAKVRGYINSFPTGLESLDLGILGYNDSQDFTIDITEVKINGETVQISDSTMTRGDIDFGKVTLTTPYAGTVYSIEVTFETTGVPTTFGRYTDGYYSIVINDIFGGDIFDSIELTDGENNEANATYTNGTTYDYSDIQTIQIDVTTNSEIEAYTTTNAEYWDRDQTTLTAINNNGTVTIQGGNIPESDISRLLLWCDSPFDITAIRFYDENGVILTLGADSSTPYMTLKQDSSFRFEKNQLNGTNLEESKDAITGFEMEIRPVKVNGAFDLNFDYGDEKFEHKWFDARDYRLTTTIRRDFNGAMFTGGWECLDIKAYDDEYALLGVRFYDVDDNTVYGVGTLADGTSLTIPIETPGGYSFIAPGVTGILDIDDALDGSGFTADEIYSMAVEVSPYGNFNVNDPAETFVNIASTIKTDALSDTYTVGGPDCTVAYLLAHGFEKDQQGNVFGTVNFTNGDDPLFAAGGDHKYEVRSLNPNEVFTLNRVRFYDEDNNVIFDTSEEYGDITVTFSAGTGAVIDQATATAREYGRLTLTALPTPTKEGYRFLGWYTEENGAGTAVTIDDIYGDESVTVYANWRDATIVRGDVNGDGKILTNDVTLLRKYLAKNWGVEDQVILENADVNGDGKILTNDVTLLRKYLARNWGVELN